MNDSLGDVRIHTGPKAAKSCEDIDVASRVQDSASSPIKGATTGGTKGWAVGATVAGPVGGVLGGITGAALGAALTTQLGEDIAGNVQQIIRDVLGMKTDQEFDRSGETGDYPGSE